MGNVLHRALPEDIDHLLPLMQEYSEFDRLEFDSRRAMLALLGNRSLGRVWFIHEPFRGRGVGTRALEAAGEAARAEGVVALHLEVRRDNADAQRYYERRGFVRRDRYFLLTPRLCD
ncbi:MAG TPA: GNAT family N-acetyltransferase [Steroidobacteraceae bacterium]